MTDEGYRGPQVCSIVGITYRQLDYWARTDFIRPTVADARGSGTQRRYGYHDLVELKIVKSLQNVGIGLPWARRAIAQLRDLDPREAIVEARSGAIRVVIDLEAVEAEVNAAIEALQAPRIA